jgi:hypothetical protein
MPIKGRTRALLEKDGRAGTRTGQALSWGRSLPSPAWTLVTPYCKRTRPGRGTNTPVSGRLAPSPLRARPRARPIWAGARGTHSSARGTPRSQNADSWRSRVSAQGTALPWARLAPLAEGAPDNLVPQSQKP